MNNGENLYYLKNIFFTGRTNLIDGIDNLDNQRIIILNGLPGVGKTSVAIEYMHRRVGDKTFKRAYWFDADDKEKITANFFLYGTMMDDNNSSIGRDDTIKNFIESIKDSNDVLLVFDNVEALNDVVDAINIHLIKCKVLITTRNLRVFSDKATMIDVPPFDLDESREFLRKRLSNLNESQIEAIIEKLRESSLTDKTLPYYLVMIASSFSNNSETIEFNNEYMKRFLENIEVRSKEVIYLLKYIMLIDPDNIPGKLIEEILLTRGDYKKAVKVLKEQNLYNMINPNTKHYGISIHRLLQQDLKDNLGLTQEQIDDLTKELLVYLENLFPETKYQPDENWNSADLYYMHIKKLEHVIPSLEKITAARLFYKLSMYKGYVLKDYNLMKSDLARALGFLDTLSYSTDLAKIHFGTGSAYSFLGDENKAIEMYKLTAATYERIYGQNCNCDLARAYNYIGKTYSILGNYKEALEYKERALKMRMEYFKGKDDSDIAASYDSIATSYLNLNDSQKALEYCKLSLEMRKRLFQGNNYYLAMSYNFIGLIYYNMGNQKLALENYDSALMIRLNIFRNNDNAEIAVSYNNIGCCYSALKNEAKGIEYKMKSLEMRERLYKGNHMRKAVSYHDVGRSMSYLGKEEEALQYYQKSLEMKNTIFKDVNFDFVLMHKDIATSYAILGNMNKALEHFQISLEIIQKLNKEDLVYNAAVFYEMGQMYSCFGNEIEALECFKNALGMQQRFFSNDNRNVVLSLNAVSLSYAILGDQDKALEHHNQSFEMHSRLFTEDDLEKAVLVNDLGLIYSYTGQQEKAIGQFKKSIAMVKKISEEEDHPDIASSFNNIGMAYSKLGNETEALKYHENCLNMRKALFTRDSCHVANSYNDIGKCNSKLKNWNTALDFFKLSLEMNERLYKQTDHPDVAETCENMSEVYLNLGDSELASKCHEKSIELKRKSLVILIHSI